MPKRTHPLPPELTELAHRCRDAFESARDHGVRTDSMPHLDKATVSRLVPRQKPGAAPSIANPSASVLIWFARACGVRPGWLLTGEEPREGDLHRVQNRPDLFVSIPQGASEITIYTEHGGAGDAAPVPSEIEHPGKRLLDPGRRAQ